MVSSCYWELGKHIILAEQNMSDTKLPKSVESSSDPRGCGGCRDSCCAWGYPSGYLGNFVTKPPSNGKPPSVDNSKSREVCKHGCVSKHFSPLALFLGLKLAQTLDI